MNQMTAKDLIKILEMIPEDSIITGVYSDYNSGGHMAAIETPDMKSWNSHGKEKNDLDTIYSNSFSITDCRDIKGMPEEGRKVYVEFGEIN